MCGISDRCGEVPITLNCDGSFCGALAEIARLNVFPPASCA